MKEHHEIELELMCEDKELSEPRKNAAKFAVALIADLKRQLLENRYKSK